MCAFQAAVSLKSSQLGVELGYSPSSLTTQLFSPQVSPWCPPPYQLATVRHKGSQLIAVYGGSELLQCC